MNQTTIKELKNGLKKDLVMDEMITLTTTSSGSGRKSEQLQCIPLRKALALQPAFALQVRSEDGMSLLLSPDDLDQAVLCLREDILTLVFPQDGHRRRWLKNPQTFIPVSCEE